LLYLLGEDFVLLMVGGVTWEPVGLHITFLGCEVRLRVHHQLIKHGVEQLRTFPVKHAFMEFVDQIHQLLVL
jgi:hypothetical protein